MNACRSPRRWKHPSSATASSSVGWPPRRCCRTWSRSSPTGRRTSYCAIRASTRPRSSPARLGIPTAQVAISVAEGEAASIGVAAPALEEHRAGLVDELWASPYLTRFPASLDPSPFPTTIRFREPATAVAEPLPDWWSGSGAPLVYVTFGTVLGFMTFAADVYRIALRAVRPSTPACC